MADAKIDSVLVVSHTSDLAGPTEALVRYLTGAATRLTAVLNPLEYCVSQRRRAFMVENGSTSELAPPGVRLPSVANWLLDVLMAVYYGIRGGRHAIFIGCNCLNASVGCLLRSMGLVRRVIFYAIDWTPTRFANPALNRIYHAIDRYAARHSDELWSITTRISDIRKEQGIPQHKLKVVPVGVFKDQIKPHARSADDRWKVIFLGALERSKGIELVIECWPQVVARWPQAELVVIGRTPKGVVARPYEEVLATLPNVSVRGLMGHEAVLQVLPTMGIGLAPYAPVAGSISGYADPSRVKDYLACGLPVFITRVPPIAAEIEHARAGCAIEYTSAALLAAFEQIFDNPSGFLTMSERAAALGASYEWNAIFNSALVRQPA